MAKHLLHGLGQLIWQETIGKPLHIEPGVPPTTTTFVPTLQCSSGTQPSMVLRVSGHTSPETWCGITWQVSEQNEPKEVCPTGYTAPFYSSASNFGHTWRNLSYLVLWRAGAFTPGLNKIIVGNNSTWYAQTVKYTFGTFGTMGLLTPSTPAANPASYLILDNYFGSHTHNGITYTWARGTNW